MRHWSDPFVSLSDVIFTDSGNKVTPHSSKQIQLWDMYSEMRLIKGSSKFWFDRRDRFFLKYMFWWQLSRVLCLPSVSLVVFFCPLTGSPAARPLPWSEMKYGHLFRNMSTAAKTKIGPSSWPSGTRGQSLWAPVHRPSSPMCPPVKNRLIKEVKLRGWQ